MDTPLSGFMVALVVVAACGAEPAEQPTLDARHLRMIRRLPVQHNGRWSPLDTAAREIVTQVTGTSHWQGRDPVFVLLDWTFRPQAGGAERLIRVPSGEVHRLVGLPSDRDRFSLAFLQDHDGLNERLSAAMRKRRQGIKIDALDDKAEDVASAMSTLVGVLGNNVIRCVPHPTDAKGRWTSVSQQGGRPIESLELARRRWDDVRAAFLSSDGPRFDSDTVALAAALARLDAGHRPDRGLLELEIRYNRLNPFRRAWILAAAAALLAVTAMVLRRRWVDVVVWLIAACTFGLATYGLAMRWQLADRTPAANMYESVIFMGWGLCLATMVCLVVVRNRLVTLVTSLMAAVSFLLGDVLPIDSSIRPVAPVLLDTAWMAIHVPVIMVSYSVLMVAMGFSITLLVMHAATPRRTDLITVADHLHMRFIQVGVILLTTGVVTGSMWGSASWGRYWGWDPKEVWSLIALLGYVAVLHARATGWIRAFGTALAGTAAFWLIVMTYVGVNYVLGIGLHSYAFGKGAVVRWLMLVGGLQLALTTVLVVVHLFRRSSASVAAPAAAE